MAIRLIGIDIDGTLLDSQHQLPAANAVAIVEAARRGVEIALVTGRRFDFARDIFEQIPCPLTLIVNNGALVKGKDGTTHLRNLLPQATARIVLEQTRAWRTGVALVFDRPRQNQIVWERMDLDNPGRRAYFERNREFIAQMPLEQALMEDPIQVMFTGGVAAMREVQVALAALTKANGHALAFSIAYTEYEARDFALVDVLAPGCTKGAALAAWCTQRAIPREAVMAIGDNYNDAEMLEFAGLPVVMGNAVAGLRRNGWHVTGTQDEAGVAAAIRRFVFGE